MVDPLSSITHPNVSSTPKSATPIDATQPQAPSNNSAQTSLATGSSPIASGASKTAANSVTANVNANEVQIPVSLKLSSKSDTLVVNSIRYQVTFQTTADRATAKASVSYLLNSQIISALSGFSKASPAVTQTGEIKATDISAHRGTLLVLGKPISIPLPKALQQLITEQNINLKQLQQISAREQGYILPKASLIHQNLIFANESKIPLPPKTLHELTALAATNSATNGASKSTGLTVIPSIHYQNKQWMLTLKPQLGDLNIKISPETASNMSSPVNLQQTIIAKPEISNIYSQLFKLLSSSDTGAMQSSNKEFTNPLLKSTPGHDIQSKIMPNQSSSTKVDKLGLPQEQAKEQTAIQAAKPGLIQNHLEKALGKAGSLPETVLTKPSVANSSAATSSTINASNLSQPYENILAKSVSTNKPLDNLFSKLALIIPQLKPLPLGALAIPNTIRQELAGLLNINSPITMQSQSLSGFSHMNSVSLLFQLLLGVRANNTGNTSKANISAVKHLHKLQAQLSNQSALLNSLDKAGATETIGKLVSNLNIYSQASNDTSTAANWYFTLPYSLNQHQEQLEGHFSKEVDNDDENSNHWRLQLKFNLNEGPLLIQANVKNARLKMLFNGDNHALLTRIEQLLPPLVKKIGDIGLRPDTVETKFAKVPATLLPGEHFLVKVKV
ncbi:hypothetical protein [Shewanella sp. UCD-KL12]|uniref:hypothetical protein n=1 Tax=Shewanella sp. UCD-KL12 TaxID=1917163 RepID=UPI000970DE2C|nr:hypothetical protein [Shewanella sp. UCD-KL12]